jgi:GH43 family beta-xylosidase
MMVQPTHDPNRHTRAQQFFWNDDDTLNFGIPVPDGPLPEQEQP